MASDSVHGPILLKSSLCEPTHASLGPANKLLDASPEQFGSVAVHAVHTLHAGPGDKLMLKHTCKIENLAAISK